MFERCNGVIGSRVEGTSFEELSHGESSDSEGAISHIRQKQSYNPDSFRGKVITELDQCTCNHLGDDGKCNAPVLMARVVTERVVRAVALHGDGSRKGAVESLSDWESYSLSLGDQHASIMNDIENLLPGRVAVSEDDVIKLAQKAAAVASSNRIACPVLKK